MTQDYAATTDDVLVLVQPMFLEDQSEPDECRYIWAYRVRIVNQGKEAVQLIHRSWEITDSHGHTVKVNGPGVIGEQPVIKAGASYEYMSGTPLATPSGFMVGKYHMIIPTSGKTFDVAIPAFSLDSPHSMGMLH